MVKIQGQFDGRSDEEKLDAIIREACERRGYTLHVSGWARKTYDVFKEDLKKAQSQHLARVESFVTTSGEVRIFDDQVLDLAQEIAEAVEKTFGLEEAVILREKTPDH